MSIGVGDVVEIISCHPTAVGAKRELVGTQAVVTDLFTWRGIPAAHTAPDTKMATGWFITSLRKINPPDWSAPTTTDHEIEA